MPGILPMKVIKIGATTQSRVAQACDRCRSKKIRCDGITPCCSQCANVGFECKTSDKLSRRAFPRGYTESLEERVRSLESEVRELKDLLDTKDEKIDVLSRIRSTSPIQARASSKSSSASSVASSSDAHIGRLPKSESTVGLGESPCTEDESITIQSSAAASSGKAFIDSFRADLKARQPQVPNFRAQAFFNSLDDHSTPPHTSTVSAVPSRMASDHLMNIFLQEWLPLFPILHRPTILKTYSSYVADPDCIDSKHDVAQLYLIFGISAISAKWNDHDPKLFEVKWKSALDVAVKQISVSSLQCLLLAMLHSIAKHDFEKLRKYTAMSAKLSRRLGLHQSQKRSSLGPLTTETRKRLFWTLHILDCFSSGMLGQSRALCDIDIACEYPQDIDDENVTDEAFLVPTPGESTRISSGLALFRGSLVLADILDTVYPPASLHEVSIHSIGSLSEQLDSWYASLAPHLCLKFLQDKPSTGMIGSRSPFLSLMYHYSRTLLYRPLFINENNPQANTALVTLAQSSKHIIQLVQLLEERRLSFSFCVNKYHLLTMAGFGLLYPILRSNRGSRITQECQRYLRVTYSILSRDKVSCHEEFRKIISMVAPASLGPTQGHYGNLQVSGAQPASQAYLNGLKAQPRQQGNQQSHARSSSAKVPKSARVKLEPRDESFLARAPFSDSDLANNSGLTPLDTSNASMTRPFPFLNRPHSFPVTSNQASTEPFSLPNLDYLDFGSEPPSSQEPSAGSKGVELTNDPFSPQSQADNMFSADAFSYISGPTTDSCTWSPDMWTTSLATQRIQPNSSLSLSEESLTSGEDLSSCGSFLPQDFLTMAR